MEITISSQMALVLVVDNVVLVMVVVVSMQFYGGCNTKDDSYLQLLQRHYQSQW